MYTLTTYIPVNHKILQVFCPDCGYIGDKKRIFQICKSCKNMYLTIEAYKLVTAEVVTKEEKFNVEWE